MTNHFRRFITKDRLSPLINDLNQPLLVCGDNGMRKEIDDAVQVHLCSTRHIDIGQRQHNTFAPLIGQIRENPHQEPAPTGILNFGFLKPAGFQDQSKVAQQMSVSKSIVKRLNRSTDIVQHETEDLTNPRGEPTNPKLTIEKQGMNLGAVQQVFHVVGQHSQLLDLALMFRVHRIKFFID